MIILIAGTTHTGKTLLAQRLLERYKYPYLSLDHLKMGLIRSGNTELTPLDDDELTPYLWSIASQMIKTAIENKQNLIIEGCYIPFDWKKSFTDEYLKNIKYICLIMTEDYIRNHFDLIKSNANAIEHRIDDSALGKEKLIKENLLNLENAKKHALPYILIDGDYDADINIQLSEICGRLNTV